MGALIAGRFRLCSLLAVGGTSCLYRAWDQYAASAGLNDPSVVIKVPRRVVEADCGTDLIFREVAVSRRIRHSGVISIFDLHQHHGRFFLTQELIRGESLRERLDRAGGRGLPYSACMAIGRQLAAAIGSLHAAGLVHSDIKPGNVLLGRDGRLCLIDLATARSTASADDIAAPPFHGFSPAYASPQTLGDEPARPADDVYSLACLLYEQLAGYHPFAGIDARRARAEGHTARRPPAVGHCQWRVLRRALAFKAERRPASVERFWRTFVGARYLAPLIVLTLVLATAALFGLATANQAGPPGLAASTHLAINSSFPEGR
ncbi:serine/threonine-protein kinase [Aquisalimonas lutea]|uniref:serine/threonine-protein kinase n=1 Tax=Aquisalimonas lutea TaxID=1327750 RepID=UPI0025B3FE20|nr:serine/threonine-protein kinase [Aquisalimonas lutea]MDN3519583.1 serine/threonine-protein kinase [Aquisalimonas lutea]